jgi:acetyltransferase-like isoleucine patch superfamily enzyme
MESSIHELAEVEEGSVIGAGTKVWRWAHIREGARIGSECTIGDGAYIDKNVTVRDRCKVMNGAKLFHPAYVGTGAFIGPDAQLLNDKNPRATNPDGTVQKEQDWKAERVWVHSYASIGAGAIILPGVSIGEHAVIGAGAVVTKDVPRNGQWLGFKERTILQIPEEYADQSVLAQLLQEAIKEEDWEDAEFLIRQISKG